MVEISEGYYRSSRYNISDSDYFDNNSQVNFFDNYASMDSTTWNKRSA
jgi:hypothetical protein